MQEVDSDRAKPQASLQWSKDGRKPTMTELVFLIEDDPDGGYTARSLGESIFTQADDMETLREMIRDAVMCHFPNEQLRPKMIRLHLVRDEVIAL